MRPWGVHTISDIYCAGCEAGLPDGTWAAGVAEPYTANRLVTAWWVLTGKAHALKWPKPGDLERTLGWTPKPRIPRPQNERDAISDKIPLLFGNVPENWNELGKECAKSLQKAMVEDLIAHCHCHCHCGWLGLNSKLNNGHCPVCAATFTARPPKTDRAQESHQQPSLGRGEAI